MWLLEVLTTQNIVWLTGVGAVIISTLVQKLSKRFKPWSWLAEQFGKAINKEMLDKFDNIQEKVDALERRNKQQDAKKDEDDALKARRRIIRFADEVRRKEKHSEEYFNNILEDISNYKDYCDTHPEFENEKAVIAIKIIEQAYEHCIRENDFL